MFLWVKNSVFLLKNFYSHKYFLILSDCLLSKSVFIKKYAAPY